MAGITGGIVTAAAFLQSSACTTCMIAPTPPTCLACLVSVGVAGTVSVAAALNCQPTDIPAECLEDQNDGASGGGDGDDSGGGDSSGGSSGGETSTTITYLDCWMNQSGGATCRVVTVTIYTS